MDNFLDFIIKDIEAKKTLFSTAPTKTKTNRKKLYEQLESTEQKYENYKTNIYNYLKAKAKALNIKEKDPNIEVLKQKMKELEQIKFLLNPYNTYFEKMGFDVLLFQINNYYAFNFSSLNTIINGFLQKFEMAGVLLQSDDFNYTYYVHEYMKSFLDVYYKKSENYSKVSEVFEQIYFLNPEIIAHIELNFRKLIASNKAKFTSYIAKLQKEIMDKHHIKDYPSCIEELKSVYSKLIEAEKEDINTIIELAKKKEIDIEQYFEENKVRKTAFQTIIADHIDYHNKEDMNDICTSLEKLKSNIEEYRNYIKFLPIINNFKEQYQKLITEENKNIEHKGLREIKEKINKKEEELMRLNRKIFGSKPLFFDFKNENNLKALKVESVQKAKELYDLYKVYDQEFFKDKIRTTLDKTLSVTDLLNLYYSFDYFKKLAIKEGYHIKSYEEIVKYSEEFDAFAENSLNVVMPGVLVFDETRIGRVIANKYRLSNIKIIEDDLSENNLDTLSNKISLILRVNRIENSNTTVEKVWFITEVEKINTNQNKKM